MSSTPAIPTNSNWASVSFSGEATCYDITDWNENRTAANVPYVSSCTSGKTFRVKGPRDYTVSITLLAHEGKYIPSIIVGGAVTMTLISFTGVSKTVTVKCTAANLESQISSGDPLSITYEFAALDGTSYGEFVTA